MSAYDVAVQALELSGIFAIAALGASLCLGRNLNGAAVTLFGLISALGGSVVRDLVLGAPPVAFHSVDRPAVALAAGLGVVLLHRHVSRVVVPLRVVEAVGLGALCVDGTEKAFAAGQSPLASAALGVVTVVGGGVVRDVLTGRAPAAFQRGRGARPGLIALAAVAAVALLELGRLDHVTAPIVAVGAGAALMLSAPLRGGLAPAGDDRAASPANGLGEAVRRAACRSTAAVGRARSG